MRIPKFVMFLALLMLPTAALAEGPSDPGEDEISLKNGGMLRGTIVAVDPDVEATIVVNGKQRTVPWAKIDKVERGKYKAAAPSKAEGDKDATAGKDDEAPASGDGAPRVHIESDYPKVQIMRIDATIAVVGSRGSATGIVTRPVCTAPCDKVVDGRDGSQFFFTAPGMVGSSAFSLTDKSGDLTARIQGGSAGKRMGGFIMTTSGGALLMAGALVLTIGAISTDISYDDAGNSTETHGNATAMTIGGIGLGVGAALLVPGIIFLSTSGTKYELVPSTARTTGVRIEGGRLLF